MKKAPRTLNVKQVTTEQICREWQVKFTTNQNPCYARCNAKGEINWEKTCVYAATELVGRNNVKVLT